MKYTMTLKVRVKDRHANHLLQQACSVNFVWNYLNELSARFIREKRRYLSAFDMHRFTKGAGKELGLHSQTLQVVAKEYVTRRIQFRKTQLNWRKSKGTHRSLGWIPVNTGAARFKNGQVYFNGHYYKVWDSYGLAQFQFRTASFTEDSRGRWYFNVVVSSESKPSTGTESVGIDLGCKEAATDSNGEGITGRDYRALEKALGTAQRARKKKRVRALHAKIRNRRKDRQHKYSRKLVENNAAIFVGNVLSSKLVKTKLAKSVLDAGWYQLKAMLEYKCANAGIVYEEIDESYSTQTCSICGSLPQSRPKGIAGLGIREWICSECGAEHKNRDINAAKNILAAGHRRLAVGITVL